MKIAKIAAMLLGIGLTLEASALDKVTFMPPWLPQSQFAGFYVALDKGFYKEEGLDVTIEHQGINSSKNSIARVIDGEVDIIGSSPITALLARDMGNRLVNVSQISQRSGLMVVSHQPIDSLQALNGKKIARWSTGFSEICEICCISNNLQVQWVPFLSGINVFISGAVDATVAMSYNEYNSLLEAMGEIPESNIIRFSDYGYTLPEDGIYVREEYLESHKDIVERFCRASEKAWLWTNEHQDEALEIVLKHMDECGIKSSRFHQKLMIEEMCRLMVNPDSGKIDFKKIEREEFDRLIKLLTQLNYISETVDYNDFVK